MTETRCFLCFEPSPHLVRAGGVPEGYICDRHWWFGWGFTLVLFAGTLAVALSIPGRDPDGSGRDWVKGPLILGLTPWLVFGFLRSLRERRRVRLQRARAGRCAGAASITPARQSGDNYERRQGTGRVPWPPSR